MVRAAAGTPIRSSAVAKGEVPGTTSSHGTTAMMRIIEST